MSWLTNVMAGDSKIKSELVELAHKTKDESIPANERLLAMFELALAVQAGEKLQAMFDGLDDGSLEEEDEEPKYVWKNGARVRVK